MSIYGSTMILVNPVKEQIEESYDLFSENFILTESIVLNEFYNQKTILESFSGSINERKFIEEKCELLLEISFKDIKDKIKNLIEEFVRFIKKVISKIKEIFTNEKIKKAEEEINELKRNLSKKEEELNIKNSSISDLEEILKDFKEMNKKSAEDLVERQKQLEEMKNKQNERINKLEKNNDFVRRMTIDALEDNEKYERNINKIKIDPIINFDLLDFIDRGDALFNDSAYIKSIDNILHNSYKADHKTDVNDFRTDFKYNLEDALNELRIIKPEFEKKLTKMNKDKATLDKGRATPGNIILGKPHLKRDDIINAVEEELKKSLTSMQVATYTDRTMVKDFVKIIEKINNRAKNQLQSCIELISKYERLTIVFKKQMEKIINNKDDEKLEKKINNLSIITNYTISMMKDQIQFLYIMTSFCGRQSGYCYTTAKLLNSILSE